MIKNEIQVFANKEFGEIRTVEINGEVWFVGKDIADKLGYTNSSVTFYKGRRAIVFTCWTQSGRRMIYDVLKSHGVFPICEQRCGCGLC